MSQTCNECGRSVRPGSGWFVNRVPDLNEPDERRGMGKPFPEGDFICAECDQEIFAPERPECPKCGKLAGVQDPVENVVWPCLECYEALRLAERGDDDEL